MGERRRLWVCSNPGCGATLGVLSNPQGGYARLWPILTALDRIEVEGYEAQVTCARCQTTRVWLTKQVDAA